MLEYPEPVFFTSRFKESHFQTLVFKPNWVKNNSTCFQNGGGVFLVRKDLSHR